MRIGEIFLHLFESKLKRSTWFEPTTCTVRPTIPPLFYNLAKCFLVMLTYVSGAPNQT